MNLMNTVKNVNELNQLVGIKVSDWSPRKFPDKQIIIGNFCVLERVNKEAHFNDLY